MADPPAMSLMLQVIILPDSLQLPGPADAKTKLALGCSVSVITTDWHVSGPLLVTITV
jgi:hypothetical protein